MQCEPQVINQEFCIKATTSIASFLNTLDELPDLGRVSERYRDLALRDHQRMVEKVREDAYRAHRLAQCKCLRCQYRGTVAGAAITYRRCGLCLEDQMYSSTNTGVLCVACASEHGLCSHCGGDIAANTDRTDYPASAGTEPATTQAES